VFPRDIVCLRNMSINTLHKGDDDDDDNNNNNNNVSFRLSQYMPLISLRSLNCLVPWYVLCEVEPSPLYTIRINVRAHQRTRPNKRSPYVFHTKTHARKWCKVFKCVIILENPHKRTYKITNTTKYACV